MENSTCKNCYYKAMYYHMTKASEDAIRTLVKAQQECEDIFLTVDIPQSEEATAQQCPGNC